MKCKVYLRFILLFVFALFVSCKKSAIQSDLEPLKEHFKDDFFVGAAIEDYQVDSPAHVELLQHHFNSITAENDMKPENICPQPNQYYFTYADKIVDFAQDNDMKVRGHTLVWHNQTPTWFFIENDDTISKEGLKKRMEEYITRVMQHFKGKVYAWDVVNEVIDPEAEDGYRMSTWYYIMKEEFIELAFRYARKADPDAKLFYNDFGTAEPRRRDLIVKMIKGLKEKGVPIDGIGMQMHVDLYKPTIKQFERALQAYIDLGLEIHITELDLSVYRNDKQKFAAFDPELTNKQGHRAKALFDVIKKYKRHITSVTFWGMADDHTWLTYHPVTRNNWPLPFDKELKAKPFYWGLVDPKKLAPVQEEEVVEKAGSSNDDPAIVKYGKARIDGKKDKAYSATEPLVIDTFIQGIDNENSKTSGATGKAWVVWDKKNLYVYMEISDAKLSLANDVPYLQDSVEIFLDEDNSKLDSYHPDDFQIRLNYENRQSFGSTDSPKGLKSAAKKIPGGYVVEAKIPFQKVKKEDTLIGFDLQINDDQGTSRRDSISKWQDKTNDSWQSTAGFGVLQLKKK